MDELIRRLLDTAESTQDSLEHTDWLEGTTPETLEKLYVLYAAKFQDALVQLTAALGAPERTLPHDSRWFSGWYPEAFAGAAWWRKGKLVCLAAEHHDKETPVALILRSLTKQDLQELGGAT
jgi:hypothetical protein